MKKKNLQIKTKEVRLALRRLLAELDKADLTGLGDRVRKGGLAKTELAWLETLRRAESEINEWCPNLEAGPNQFTIDVPPKS